MKQSEFHRTNNWETEIMTFFEGKGVRWTPQRQMVVSTMQQAQGHVTAEEIHRQITEHFPKVNLSTVYRCLELLCEMGIMVEVVNRNDDRKRFELVWETPHYHLRCEKCSGTFEVDDKLIDRFKAETHERFGFKPELSHFLGYGLCAHCLGDTATHSN